MTIIPSGTDAKDIALHFIKLTTGRATPSIMAKTIIQAKSLLSSGYTKEEILSVIDYLLKIKGMDIYSLGYVSSAINNVLKEMNKEKDKQKSAEIKEQMKQTSESNIKEVIASDESTQRNRDKSNGFGIQPRFGEKSFSDLFKGD
jgi:hypothetical protein